MLERFDINKIKVYAFFILVLMFGIFLGNNFHTVDIWVFGWTFQISVIFLMLLSFIFGGICSYVISVWFRHRHDADEI